MLNTNVEDVTSGSDKAKVALGVALAVAGIAAYYYFTKQASVARFAMIVVGFMAGVAVIWTSGDRHLLGAVYAFKRSRDRSDRISRTLRPN